MTASSKSTISASSVMDRVDSLRRQLAGLVTLNDESKSVISWGCDELDQFMPGGAVQPGMIVELLYGQRGSGAGSLAMHCAKQAVTQQQGPLVVVDRGSRFYPPAAVARGIESRDLIVIRPSDERRGGMSAAEEIWALDQALRCPGVAVVTAWMDKIDPNAYRRLQLAAEAGQTLALLIRPERVRAFPTWADIQLQVDPTRSIATNGMDARPAHAAVSLNALGPGTHVSVSNENRFVQITLLRQRGRVGSNIEGAQLNLEIDETHGTLQAFAGTVNRNEARTMHMAPRVAHPTTRRRSAGA